MSCVSFLNLLHQCELPASFYFILFYFTFTRERLSHGSSVQWRNNKWRFQVWGLNGNWQLPPGYPWRSKLRLTLLSGTPCWRSPHHSPAIRLFHWSPLTTLSSKSNSMQILLSGFASGEFSLRPCYSWDTKATYCDMKPHVFCMTHKEPLFNATCYIAANCSLHAFRVPRFWICGQKLRNIEYSILFFSEKRCPTLAMPANGGFKCVDGAYFNSRCEYYCSPGYTLKGERTVTCMDTKTWSGPPASCVGK